MAKKKASMWPIESTMNTKRTIQCQQKDGNHEQYLRFRHGFMRLRNAVLAARQARYKMLRCQVGRRIAAMEAQPQAPADRRDKQEIERTSRER